MNLVLINYAQRHQEAPHFLLLLCIKSLVYYPMLYLLHKEHYRDSDGDSLIAFNLVAPTNGDRQYGAFFLNEELLKLEKNELPQACPHAILAQVFICGLLIHTQVLQHKQGKFPRDGHITPQANCREME